MKMTSKRARNEHQVLHELKREFRRSSDTLLRI